MIDVCIIGGCAVVALVLLWKAPAITESLGHRWAKGKLKAMLDATKGEDNDG